MRQYKIVTFSILTVIKKSSCDYIMNSQEWRTNTSSPYIIGMFITHSSTRVHTYSHVCASPYIIGMFITHSSTRVHTYSHVCERGSFVRVRTCIQMRNRVHQYSILGPILHTSGVGIMQRLIKF